MQLSDIDLKGLGRFENSPAGFTVTRYHLPAAWEHQYNNGQGLLRVRQDGGVFLQIAPPGGPLLLNMERHGAPAMFTWIIPQDGKSSRAFSNFWGPQFPAAEIGSEPEVYSCNYSPEMAKFHLLHDDLNVDTDLWLAPDEIAIVQSVTITNRGSNKRTLSLMPVIRPHLAAVMLAPWDVPHWYQTVAYSKFGDADGFWAEMRDPGGNPAKRLRAAIVSDLAPTSFEVSADDYLGAGRWDSPQAVAEGKLARNTRGKIPAYGEVTGANAVVGRAPVAAMARSVTIAPGKSFRFTIVMAKLAETNDGSLPKRTDVARLTRYFTEKTQQQAMNTLRKKNEKLFNIRRIETPDEALNQYVNEHLALQLWQVQDRGWTNMRGVRDSAQDATAFVPIDPALAKDRLIEILEFQRSDGWFLRQYSLSGKNAKHDDRPYVDSGLWVWELLWEYLVWTRDFAILKQKVGWLDVKSRDTVLEHATRLLAYFLDKENIGEHGLCKIREGDWNDSVNAAGFEGRGETVMVTCQLVLALEQAAELLDVLKQNAAKAKQYRKLADTFRANLLKHARNREGYFNGVFTDAGQWVFSPKDPDGAHRINSTPNTFAIIAGVVKGRQRDQVLSALQSLKGPYGYRLFYPAIGNPPIKKLGRIGQGDLAPGMGENGTPYNHGSHGFLGRAAWSAGKGKLLYEVMRYMLPYDQKAHPVARTKSPPYLIVNNYLEAPGQEGAGGYPFLTGSIPVAARNIYEGFIGFRPGLRHLVIDPVIPADWKHLSAEVTFLDATFRVEIRNPQGVESGVKSITIDGDDVGEGWFDERLDRRVVGIPIEKLKRGKDHAIEVTLGK